LVRRVHFAHYLPSSGTELHVQGVVPSKHPE